MPLYEYTCKECQHNFESLVFGEETVACPKCQAENVQKHLSLPARPQTPEANLPMACDSQGPPCGAPWCKRTGS